MSYRGLSLLSDDAARRVFEAFTSQELRLLSLTALGYTQQDVRSRMYLSRPEFERIVSSCQEKTGLERLGSCLFYVAKLLPFDAESDGVPGRKYQVWLQRAEQRRTELLSREGLGPVVFEAAMVQASLDRADLDDEALGALLSRPVKGTTFGEYVRSACIALRHIVIQERAQQKIQYLPLTPMPNGRARLLTIGYLAPLVK